MQKVNAKIIAIGAVVMLVAIYIATNGSFFGLLRTSGPVQTGTVTGTLNTQGLANPSYLLGVTAQTQSGQTISANSPVSLLPVGPCTGSSCPGDACGNGICNIAAGEQYIDCPQDCTSIPSCGDGVYQPPIENSNSCPHDIPGIECGNGFCHPFESAISCPIDCHVCKDPDGNTFGAPSGIPNGICEPGEAPWTCPQDCPSYPRCGDRICYKNGSITENSLNCPGDCAPQCSDGRDNDRPGDIYSDGNDSMCHSDGNPWDNSTRIVDRDTEVKVGTPNSSNDATSSCANNIDDDGDGCADGGDRDCRVGPGNALVWDASREEDNSHAFSGCLSIPNQPACSDSNDNDGDSLIDANDPQCIMTCNFANGSSYVSYRPLHTSEEVGPTCNVIPGPSLIPIPTFTGTPTPLPTATPVPTFTGTPTPLPTATPVPTFTGTPTPLPSTLACGDGDDNDGDGRADQSDSFCHPVGFNGLRDGNPMNSDTYDETHNSEDRVLLSIAPVTNTPCSDNIDNDGDGCIDGGDYNCRIGAAGNWNPLIGGFPGSGTYNPNAESNDGIADHIHGDDGVCFPEGEEATVIPPTTASIFQRFLNFILGR